MSHNSHNLIKFQKTSHNSIQQYVYNTQQYVGISKNLKYNEQYLKAPKYYINYTICI